MECERHEDGTISVDAEEIQVVMGSDQNLATPCVNMDNRLIKRSPLAFERRKVYTASSFKVPSQPKHLVIVATENGGRIVDVLQRSLEPMRFAPMTRVDGVGYRETNAAEVILGLDPSRGHPWVTPVAFHHIKVSFNHGSSSGGNPKPAEISPC